MKLSVNFGDHFRTILAGIKQERANPLEIEGKQALFVLNLPARKMAGETSQGMLFDIGYSDGVNPCLSVPEKPVPSMASTMMSARISSGAAAAIAWSVSKRRHASSIRSTMR